MLANRWSLCSERVLGVKFDEIRRSVGTVFLAKSRVHTFFDEMKADIEQRIAPGIDGEPRTVGEGSVTAESGEKHREEDFEPLIPR